MEERAKIIRLAYAEHIIRCDEQDPNRMEALLSMDGNIDRARRWMAFAMAKREKDPDYVRGLLAYLISHTGRPDQEKQKWLIYQINGGNLKLGDLTYEMLEGTRLEWRYIFTLVGKEFNPSREKARVKRIYEVLTQKAGVCAKGGS